MQGLHNPFDVQSPFTRKSVDQTHEKVTPPRSTFDRSGFMISKRGPFCKIVGAASAVGNFILQKVKFG